MRRRTFLGLLIAGPAIADEAKKDKPKPPPKPKKPPGPGEPRRGDGVADTPPPRRR